MAQLTREPRLVAVEPANDSPPRPRTGIVFVPCAICLTPLDLALISDAEQPHLCERHRVGDYLPLN